MCAGDLRHATPFITLWRRLNWQQGWRGAYVDYRTLDELLFHVNYENKHQSGSFFSLFLDDTFLLFLPQIFTHPHI